MEAHLSCFQIPGSTSKQTCSQCRFRKVRCDGAIGGCRNCCRLQFACSLRAGNHSVAQSDPSWVAQPNVFDRPQRQRARKACQNCREQKIRCSGDKGKCANCKRRGAVCFYTKTRKTRTRKFTQDGVENGSQESPNSSPYHEEEPRVDEQGDHDFARLPDDITHLIDGFFDVFYPTPSYAFIHPETAKRRCAEGNLDPPLAYAICALVTHHTEVQSSNANRSVLWIQTAEQIVWQQLERLTVARLQALLLVIRFYMETGRFQRAFMLTATAARFAAAMRLNHEHSNLNPVAREVRRRVVWSLKLMERYFSIGLPEFEVCPYETIYLELPSREDEYNFTQSRRGAAQHEISEEGALKLCIELESLRRDIMKLSRSIALCDEAFPFLPRMIQHFEQQLTAVGAQIPNGNELSSSDIAGLLDNPWLPRYIFLHLSWHQCYCDLYRLLLPGYEEAAPPVVLSEFASTYQVVAEKQCLQHAAAIIRIMANLNEQSTRSWYLEFDTAICVYHALRLVFFLSGREHNATLVSRDWAASRADLSLVALKRFFPHSVLVQPIVEGIETCKEAFLAGRNDAQSPLLTAAHQKDPIQRLSTVAKAQQRLAIHSLLLQVCSKHDDDDADDETSPPLISSKEFRDQAFGRRIAFQPNQSRLLDAMQISSPNAESPSQNVPHTPSSLSTVSATAWDDNTLSCNEATFNLIGAWNFNT